MDKDVKELVKVIQKHDMECDAIPVSTCNQDCDGCLARDILKAGYILPSPSPMKLIGENPCDICASDRCTSCNPGVVKVFMEQQLSADQKAHAGMTKELIDLLQSSKRAIKGIENQPLINLIDEVLARYGG